MRRPTIPTALKNRLFYESQYVCVICQNNDCVIHHIDENHSNNEEKNLVVLCLKHHGEAHTERKLSKNLDAAALIDAKKKWVDSVYKKRELKASVSGQEQLYPDPISTPTWGYINHKRVIQMADPNLLMDKKLQLFADCKKRNLVDESGFIITPKPASPPSNSYTGNSIYDLFAFGDDHRLHALYSAFVDQISARNKPWHLEPKIWSPTQIRSLIKPGTLLFAERGFYFKGITRTKTNEHRKAFTFKGKIAIEFFVDTKDMFGTTSMTVSFSGHQSCAALILVKSIADSDSKGRLILHCTPLALGVGFASYREIS